MGRQSSRGQNCWRQHLKLGWKIQKPIHSILKTEKTKNGKEDSPRWWLPRQWQDAHRNKLKIIPWKTISKKMDPKWWPPWKTITFYQGHRKGTVSLHKVIRILNYIYLLKDIKRHGSAFSSALVRTCKHTLLSWWSSSCMHVHESWYTRSTINFYCAVSEEAKWNLPIKGGKGQGNSRK